MTIMLFKTVKYFYDTEINTKPLLLSVHQCGANGRRNYHLTVPGSDLDRDTV